MMDDLFEGLDVESVEEADEQVTPSYDKISTFYGPIERIIEKSAHEAALTLLDTHPGEHITEIGIGTGHTLASIAKCVGKKGHVTGIDIAPGMISRSQTHLRDAGLMSRATIVDEDARSLSFEDNTFDGAYCGFMLELLKENDIKQVVHELQRTLHPEGRLVALSMTKDGCESSLFVRTYEWFHRRFPTLLDCRPIYLAHALKQCGFIIENKRMMNVSYIVPVEVVRAIPEKE